MPQALPGAQPAPPAAPGTATEPGSGTAIEPPAEDSIDELILPEEERNRDPSPETLDLNADPEEAGLEPAESAPTAAAGPTSDPAAGEPDAATAGETTPGQSSIPVPKHGDTAPPPADVVRQEPVQPPAQSGTTEITTERPEESVSREAQTGAATPPPATPGRESAGAASATAPLAQRPTIDTGPLMARGQALLGEGDIASARLFFERAAEQGDSTAMTALGRTFDPLELRRLGVLGMKGDPNRALEWYRSAASAGDASAQQSMGRLSEWIERTR
jgi:hypothetical protein